MLSRFRTLKPLRVSNVVRSEIPHNRSNTNEKYAYAAGLLVSSLLFSSAVYAYGDESKVEPAKKEELTVQQQESALEATRQEIRSRVLLVLSNYLGIDASEALKLIPVMFPHLESPEDFKAILVRHRQAEGQVLAQDGSRVYIDHTILAANVTEKQIEQLCAEAKEHQFKAVCVEGGRIAQAKASLAGTDIKVAAVVGFPLGATTTQSKSLEAFEYCALGADEIDMVIDIGRIKDRDYEYVLHNVEGVVDAVSKFRWRKDAPILKVIIECCLLTREEIIDASILCYLAGAEYVKTSTGFSTHGATEEHVRLMKLTVGNDIKVKAAGGVRDKKALVSMVNQGASRIGTSSGTKLVLNANEAREEWNALQLQNNRS